MHRILWDFIFRSPTDDRNPGKERVMPEGRLFPMSEAIKEAYQHGEEEEDMYPMCLVDINKQPIGRIKNGDYVIFYDIRGEREIELTQAFTQPGFEKFPVNRRLKTQWVTMTEYHPDLDVRVAFPPSGCVDKTLSEVVSKAGMKQIKIAESEKGTHITYFLNGKKNDPYPDEEWIIIPSPGNIKNFDQCPEMRCAEVSNQVIKNINRNDIYLICANLANIDVVGHIENREAIIKAVQIVDYHVGRILREAMKAGMFTLLVADHGTVERWYYPDGKIDTGHTDSQVPFILVPPKGDENIELNSHEGSLIDIAPTVIQLLGLQIPDVMTGSNLIRSGLPAENGSRVLLLIMDGWGYNPSPEGNLIFAARTKQVDWLMENYPWMPLSASGKAVGLPAGTVGNSESGHLHIGSGRIIPSDRVKIAEAINNGEFYENPEFLWAIKGAKEDGKNLHLLGIVSFFSSHGSIEYLYTLMEMAKREGMDRIFIHSLLGRRGEKPESGAYYTSQIEEKAGLMKTGKVVSVIGRYWALDREHNWDRIEKTYNLLVKGEGREVLNEKGN